MQSLCTLRVHCRQWPRNTYCQAGATPYLGRTFTGWIAPACGWRTHSITSLARGRNDSGIVKPSVLAVTRQTRCVVTTPGRRLTLGGSGRLLLHSIFANRVDMAPSLSLSLSLSLCASAGTETATSKTPPPGDRGGALVLGTRRFSLFPPSEPRHSAAQARNNSGARLPASRRPGARFLTWLRTALP